MNFIILRSRVIRLFVFVFFALSYITTTAQDNETLARSYYMQAEEAANLKNHKKAIENLDKVVEYLATTNGRVEALYVKSYMALNNYQQAEQHLRKYFEVSDESRDDYMEMVKLTAIVKEKFEEETKEIERRKLQEQALAGELGEFVNGKKQGVWTEYWSDGTVKQKVNYVNGNINGSYKIFYDSNWKVTNDINEFTFYRNQEWKNGVMNLEIEDFYKNGALQMSGTLVSPESEKLEGEVRYYNEDGGLSQVKTILGGKRHGEQTFYYSSGNISSIKFWNNGRLSWEKQFKENGEQRDSGTFKDGNGTIIIYNKDETIKIVRHYENWKKKREDFYDKNYTSLLDSKGKLVAYIYYYDQFLTPRMHKYYHKDKLVLEFNMNKNGSVKSFGIFDQNKNQLDAFFYNENARVNIISKHTNGMPKGIKVEFEESRNRTYRSLNPKLTRNEKLQINLNKEYWILWSNTAGEISTASIKKKSNGKTIRHELLHPVLY